MGETFIVAEWLGEIVLVHPSRGRRPEPWPCVFCGRPVEWRGSPGEGWYLVPGERGPEDYEAGAMCWECEKA